VPTMRPGTVVIVVGHAKDKQGAVGPDGVAEWAFHRKTAEDVVAALDTQGVPAVVLLRDPRGAYEARMQRLCAAVAAQKPVCAVELHFNACASPMRGGAEVLHYPGSVDGEALARALLDNVAGAVGTKYGTVRHRVIAQAKTWNASGDLVDVNGDGRIDGADGPQGPPLYFLRDTDCPAVIVESHYGSNPIDHANATRARNSGALAGAIAAGLLAWLRA
jgi:N-acetylmuramoyl-L-alanine amidase